MTAVAVHLSKEQALAHRLLRQRYAPAEFFDSVAGRQVLLPAEYPWRHHGLEAQLQSLAKKLCPQSVTLSTRSTERTLVLSSILRFIQSESTRLKWRSGSGLIGAAVLPLFRATAGEPFESSLDHSLQASVELIALLGVCSELGDELVEMLSDAEVRGQFPKEVLRKELDVDLERLASIMVDVGFRWDNQSEPQLAQLITDEIRGLSRPAWSVTSSLVKIARQLLSDECEFVIPRDWIQTPISWQFVTAEIRKVAAISETVDSEPSEKHARRTPSPKSSVAARSSRSLEDSDVPSGSGDSISSQSESKHASPSGLAAWLREDTGNLPSKSDSAPVADVRSKMLDLESSIQAEVEDLLDQTGAVCAPDYSVAAAREPATLFIEALLPKVLIAEVRSHQDPAFVNVVQRQLAQSRHAGGTVTLCSIRLKPESESDGRRLDSVQANGMSAWQQNIVNRLVDHPEVQQPYAFLSGNSELILCMLEIERNAATTLVREAIVEVLSGRRAGSISPAELSQIAVPARYFVGIASVSSPSAGFSAEQLVEAAYRCLAAVEAQGKSAIKSIEAF
ncbi:MAG: hypothetical protein U0892_03620 [Pirellulales bacterium]